MSLVRYEDLSLGDTIDRTEAMGPGLRRGDNAVAACPYNHFFHLKNTYGSTAASSIMTSAIG